MQSSRPGLTHHLPVVVVLWSTFLLLTGCHPLPPSITSDPNLQSGPVIQIEPSNQACHVSLRELSMREFDEETFEKFFAERRVKPMFEKIRRYFAGTLLDHIMTDTLIFADREVAAELSKQAAYVQDILRNAITLYIAHKKRLCPFLIQGPNQEIPFEDFLVANKLYKVWNRLKSAKDNPEQSLDLNLKLSLGGCEQAMKMKVLERMVPFIINYCPNLISLDLSSNGLEALPDSFGKLTQLKRLDLTGNHLRLLPESIGNLRNLETLWLSLNELIALPETFGDLIKLHTLYLDQNKLQALPANFGNLNNLVSLYLNHNQLSALPHSFGNLIKLRTLNLRKNQLRELPATFGNHIALFTLNLSKNQLKTLPLSLQKLTNLVRCIVKGNPFLEPNATLQVTCANLQLNLFPCDEYVRKYRLKKNLNQDINREIVVITGPADSKTYIHCTHIYPVVIQFTNQVGGATLSQPVPLCVYLRGKELVERVYDEGKKPATEEKEKFFLIINK